MGENSKIEWTDHTFNPWIGCSKVSPGCTNCYAEVSTPVRVARRLGRELWGKGAQRQRTSAANWKQPLKWNLDASKTLLCFECAGDRWGSAIGGSLSGSCMKCGKERHLHELSSKRPRVFCASLSDWLDDEVPIEWLADLLKLLHDTPNLDWLLLTKRPENWSERLHLALRHSSHSSTIDDEAFISGWLDGDAPNNCWIGTTVEDQKRSDERIPELLKIPAKVRFLSVEPQLEAINLDASMPSGTYTSDCCPRFGYDHFGPIHWVINGGESGPKKRPIQLDWMRSIRDQCQAAGVAYFCKQVDKVQPIPEDLMIREFPQ